MKSLLAKTLRFLAFGAIGIFLFPAPSHAWMRWEGSGGWGPDSSYRHLFNPATVETVEGSVVRIMKFIPERGMHYGVHLALKTSKGLVDIHLGPEWYLANQDMKISRDDHISVKGSAITFDGKPVIIAETVTKDDETLLLRDPDGYPEWAGWRRHHP